MDMALSMEKVVRDTAGLTNALVEYLSMKNKILFDSGTSWDGGTKTIKDISKYQVLQCNLDLGGCSGIALRHHDTAFFGTANANYPEWFASAAFYITLNGDAATLSWGWVSNIESKAPYATYGIKRIIGIEPIIPDSLANILGGGYSVIWFGGGVRA